MADWRHVVYTLRGNVRLGEVTLGSWTLINELGGVGSWVASVVVDDQRATPAVLARSLDRARVAVVSVRDGLAVNFGIVWRSVYDAGTGRIELAGANMASYLHHRLIPQITFTQISQADIVAGLVAIANADGIGIQASQNAPGPLRDRGWVVQDAKTVGEALEELTAVRAGPDIVTRAIVDGEQVRRLLTTWSPRAGRRLDEAVSPRFTVGVNALGATIAGDGTTIANHALVVGEGEGASAIFAEHSDVDQLATTDTPRLDAYVDARTVRLVSTLTERAEGYVDTHRTETIESTTARVLPDHGAAPWTSWQLGDDAYLVMAENDPLYPSAVFERRITGVTWSMTEGGDEGLDVTLGPIEIDPPL
jgi:hypothetical protein